MHACMYHTFQLAFPPALVLHLVYDDDVAHFHRELVVVFSIVVVCALGLLLRWINRRVLTPQHTVSMHA